MNEINLWVLAQTTHHTVGGDVNAVGVIPLYSHFHWIACIAIGEFLETHSCIWKVIAIELSIIVEQSLCVLVTSCVDDELCEVRTANLRCIGRLESR